MKKASKIMRVEDSERTEVELKAFFFNSLFLWMIVYDCNHISSFFFFLISAIIFLVFITLLLFFLFLVNEFRLLIIIIIIITITIIIIYQARKASNAL
jgi:hypothetical protein